MGEGCAKEGQTVPPEVQCAAQGGIWIAALQRCKGGTHFPPPNNTARDETDRSTSVGESILVPSIANALVLPRTRLRPPPGATGAAGTAAMLLLLACLSLAQEGTIADIGPSQQPQETVVILGLGGNFQELILVAMRHPKAKIIIADKFTVDNEGIDLKKWLKYKGRHVKDLPYTVAAQSFGVTVREQARMRRRG